MFLPSRGAVLGRTEERSGAAEEDQVVDEARWHIPVVPQAQQHSNPLRLSDEQKVERDVGARQLRTTNCEPRENGCRMAESRRPQGLTNQGAERRLRC
jgi:hypothetical protein